MRILKAILLFSSLFLFKSALWGLMILVFTVKNHFVPNPFFYLYIGIWVNIMEDLVMSVYNFVHNFLVESFA
ncbi:hypothetical protein AHIS2_p013 [Acaryochloris phage A-HIS2]|nr:hypothetical protein AHIS2_p013 [Acaryochloris phage A-HIS2]